MSLVLVNTGDGKGKTTAAIGMIIRFLGWGKKVCLIQFLKSPQYPCGERLFLEKAGVEVYCLGKGFSNIGPREDHEKAIWDAWEFSKDKILKGGYDLIVLDEINCAIAFGGITAEEVVAVLKNRPEGVNVMLTGRGACQEILEYADTVTEMVERKHHYKKGIQAEKGIEY